MTSYSVTHRSTYRYSLPIASAHLRVALRARDTLSQRVQSAIVTSWPEAEHRYDYRDHLGNECTYLSIAQSHDQIEILACSQVDVDGAPLPDAAEQRWDDVVTAIDSDVSVDGLAARDLRLPSPYVPRTDDVAAYARPSFVRRRSLAASVRELTARIHADFVFDPEFTDVTTPLDQVMAARRGVCQDFAHIFIGCLRSVGLAARYVSGYIETDPPPGQQKLQGSDASHAWCSVFVPGSGWFDVDPTNDQMPTTRHVTIGWGRDYSDIAPVSGVLIGPPTTQQVSVSVDVVGN